MTASKIPPLKAKAVISVLLKSGFYVHHQKGSHVQLRNHENPHVRVTVARHDRFNLPSFVVRTILKQADISEDDFLKHL